MKKDEDKFRAEAKKLQAKRSLEDRRKQTRQNAKAQRERRNAAKPDKKGTNNRFVNPDGSPKKRPTPENRKMQNTPICGASRSKSYADDPENPGVCCQPAGWGTDHVGFGKCRFHGGTNPNGIKAAEKERIAIELLEQESRLMEIYGIDKDVDPHAALAHEVRRTAGAVEWLQTRIRDAEESDLFQTTMSGKQASALLKTYQDERDRLVAVSKAAIHAGVAERQITLAEEQGKIIAMVIRAVLTDKELGLTPQQLHDSGSIVRKHLMTLDTPQVIETTAST